MSNVTSKSTRYHVIPDKVGNGVIIFDSETGAVQYPVCWQDLAAYYYYLVERGRTEESQKLLAESMAGNKPITNMLGSATRLATFSKAAP
jgi:hypothetical protein